MPTYIIPEEIIGYPLFVPSTKDQFEIDEDGGPDGNACLLVHGDVSTDYVAFQNAPTLSIDMFRNGYLAQGGTNVPRAMSLFIKADSGGVGTLLASHSSAASVNSGAFSLAAATTNEVYFHQGYTGGSPGFSYTRRIYRQNGVCDNNWHLLVVNTSDQNGAGLTDNGIFLDTNATGGSGSGAADGTQSGTPPAATTLNKVCIGSYSSAMTAFNKEWRIAHLAFWPAYLDLAARIALYNRYL